MGLTHLLLAVNDTVTEVCPLPSALQYLRVRIGTDYSGWLSLNFSNAPRLLVGTIILLSAHRRFGCRLPNPQVCGRYYLDRAPLCSASTH